MTSEDATLRERLSQAEAEVGELRQQRAEVERQGEEARALIEQLRISVERNKTEIQETETRDPKQQKLGATSQTESAAWRPWWELAQTARVLVWLDPHIGNTKNSNYARHLRCIEGLSLTATTRRSQALRALWEREEDTEYRAMTAGKRGEAFVRKLRESGVTCPVLVFCGNVAKHSKWAARYSNVQVTNDPAMMFVFATWQT